LALQLRLFKRKQSFLL